MNRGTEQGLIFRRFEHRRVLIQAARKVLATEHEARHLSAHDFRHAALTHMAAVGSDLTAIGHVAGHKNATTTALYVHNSEAAARRPVARRAGSLDTKVDTEPDQTGDRLQSGTEAADRFRSVVRGGLGGEELAEPTNVREQAPQTARPHRATDRKRGAVSGGPSRTRTWSQWIKNPSNASPSVTNPENTGEEECPMATDQTGDAVSKPLRAFSRSTLIASLYNHASALAQAGDIEAARVAHEAAGRLLVVPEAANAVVDLNHRRKP